MSWLPEAFHQQTVHGCPEQGFIPIALLDCRTRLGHSDRVEGLALRSQVGLRLSRRHLCLFHRRVQSGPAENTLGEKGVGPGQIRLCPCLGRCCVLHLGLGADNPGSAEGLAGECNLKLALCFGRIKAPEDLAFAHQGPFGHGQFLDTAADTEGHRHFLDSFQGSSALDLKPHGSAVHTISQGGRGSEPDHQETCQDEAESQYPARDSMLAEEREK